jgi:hypothetical protein
MALECDNSTSKMANLNNVKAANHKLQDLLLLSSLEDTCPQRLKGFID